MALSGHISTSSNHNRCVSFKKKQRKTNKIKWFLHLRHFAIYFQHRLKVEDCLCVVVDLVAPKALAVSARFVCFLFCLKPGLIRRMNTISGTPTGVVYDHGVL